MYVSGREAAISGETRSVVKRPTSPLADGFDDVLFIWLIGWDPNDLGEETATEGVEEVSLVMIADVIVERGGLTQGARCDSVRRVRLQLIERYVLQSCCDL